ncbi:hypothetical protein NL533_35530, partial [Klebsiella pneumoniae]|nr:hypothetical protein [Klebsiella pneumoniae]
GQLLEALSEETFDPTAFNDEYRRRVIEFVERKAKGEKLRLHKPIEKKVSAKSLESILKASLKAVGREKKSA